MNERTAFSLPGIPFVLVLIVAALAAAFAFAALTDGPHHGGASALAPIGLSYALIAFVGKGLFQVQPNQGQVMQLTFRRLLTTEGIQNYFWKARPVPTEVSA